MTRTTTYDFTEATKYFNEWQTPRELSDDLKTAALKLAITDSGTHEELILAMQRCVYSVCEVLDSIKEKPDGI